jgi:hypothetical protein
MSAFLSAVGYDGDLNLIASAQFHHEALVPDQEGIERTQAGVKRAPGAFYGSAVCYAS